MESTMKRQRRAPRKAQRSARRTAPATLRSLERALREFTRARDWDQFHSPKNLAMALMVETAELAEPFQWLTEKQSNRLSAKKRAEVTDELADVLIYLVRLADKLNVDLLSAASAKIKKNHEKYPVAKAKGTSKKYTEL
jgi:NTP pyrophosphatase (non-canonical NTP hydrolase)